MNIFLFELTGVRSLEIDIYYLKTLKERLIISLISEDDKAIGYCHVSFLLFSFSSLTLFSGDKFNNIIIYFIK